MKQSRAIAFCAAALACLLPHPAFASMHIGKDIIAIFFLPLAAAGLLVLISLFRGDNKTRLLTLLSAVPVIALMVLPLSLCMVLFLDFYSAAATTVLSFVAALYFRAKPSPPTVGGNLNVIFNFMIGLVLIGLAAFVVQHKYAQWTAPPAWSEPKKPL